jgi:hypothetical protein
MVFWAVNPDCVTSSKETIMQNITIKNVKPGDYIKRKADAKSVYIKGAYIKSLKGFECTDADDINKTIVIKSDKTVFVGFTY